MNIKIYEKYMKELIEKAPQYGFDECSVSLASDTSMSVSIFEGEVSSFEKSVGQKISFKGLKHGQLGTAAASAIDEDTIRFLLENASENCDLLNDEDENIIYCDPEHPVLTNVHLSGAWEKNTYTRFSELGLKLEKAILNMDPLVKAVDSMTIACSTGPSILMNSKGLSIYRDADIVTIGCAVRAEKDGVVKSAGHYWYDQDIDNFEMDQFVSDLKEKLIPKFGARSVKSGNYDLIINNESTMALFDAFMSSFSSYEMAKGLSLLAGREGEKIASDCVTLREDPMTDLALFTFPFDGEGVLTSPKNIIDKGVFTTAFYSLKTAKMTGKKTTANGYSGGISASNLILMPGESDLNTLAEHVGDGILITDISGLHAGLNPITGDFSLLAEGFLISEGKIGRAVEQITVSDNFFKLINKISEVGNDLLRLPGNVGDNIFPSVIVKNVCVAGEE